MRNQRRRGQGLLELALLLPLIVLMVSLLIDLALLANAKHALNRLTAAVVEDATLCVDGRYLAPAEVRARLEERLLPPLARERLTVDVLRAEDDADRRRALTLAVRYRVPLFTPGLSLLLGAPDLTIEARDRATYPSQSPPLAAAAPPPPFAVLPSGAIQVARRTSVRVKVLRKALRREQGRREIPITLRVSDDGDEFEPIFGGDPVNGGEEMVLELEPGDRMALSARAHRRSEHTSRDVELRSDRRTEFEDRRDVAHQQVLGRGDAAPDHPSMRDPERLAPEVAPFVDASGTMKLGPQELLVMYEYSERYQGAQTDFQDLVVIVQFYDPAQGRPLTP